MIESLPKDIWTVSVVLASCVFLYVCWKVKGSKSRITLKGLSLKVMYGLFGGLLFLGLNTRFFELSNYELIIPAISFGFNVEYFLGAILQQKVEKKILEIKVRRITDAKESVGDGKDKK